MNIYSSFEFTDIRFLKGLMKKSPSFNGVNAIVDLLQIFQYCSAKCGLLSLFGIFSLVLLDICKVERLEKVLVYNPDLNNTC